MVTGSGEEMFEEVEVNEMKHVTACMKHVEVDSRCHEQQLMVVLCPLWHLTTTQALLIMSSTCGLLLGVAERVEGVEIGAPLLCENEQGVG